MKKKMSWMGNDLLLFLYSHIYTKIFDLLKMLKSFVEKARRRRAWICVIACIFVHYLGSSLNSNFLWYKLLADGNRPTNHDLMVANEL